MLAGCSFVRAREVNDPARGCSRAPATTDFVIAGIAAGTAAAIALAARCDDASPGCDEQTALFVGSGPAVILAIGALASAVYGGDVADTCTQKRR